MSVSVSVRVGELEGTSGSRSRPNGEGNSMAPQSWPTMNAAHWSTRAATSSTYSFSFVHTAHKYGALVQYVGRESESKR